MARRLVRLFHGRRYVLMQGKPPSEIPHFLCIKDGDAYWLLLWKLIAMNKEQSKKKRDERLAKRTHCGRGSGRAGGGRGAAHTRFHFREGEINWGTKPEDCPLCLSKTLWRLWLRTDYGCLPGWWDSEHDHERLVVCDLEFDRYMRTHRFEDKTIKTNVGGRFGKPTYRYYSEADLFLEFGCPGYYDRHVSHKPDLPSTGVSHEPDIPPANLSHEQNSISLVVSHEPDSERILVVA